LNANLYNVYQEEIPLTKEQESCLKQTSNNSPMIKWVVGARKSLVIQALAKEKFEGYQADKKNKVAVFTYSNTLKLATKELLDIKDEHEEYITVTTLSKYIQEAYCESGGPKRYFKRDADFSERLSKQALYLVNNEDKIPDKFKFDYILIDEAEDFSLETLRATWKLFKKELVIAMDMNQRVYKQNWTPKVLGMETTTKRLNVPVRITKQIDELTNSIIRNNDENLGEDEKTIRVTPEKEGPKTRLVHLENIDSEKKYVVEQVREWLAENDGISIGIISSQNKYPDIYGGWMTDAGISCEMVDKDSTFSMRKPGVKISTIKNAKGLEFTHVIIPQFVEENFPYSNRIDNEELLQEFVIRQRNLVYVGMTRAEHSLVITYSGNKGSRFIGEMDKNFYESVGLEPTYDTSTRVIPKVSVSKKKAVKNPPTINPPTEKTTHSKVDSNLIDFFKNRGLEVVDKRKQGGCLWVVGAETEIEAIINEAKKAFSISGKYSAGGNATKKRPGWFTKDNK
jgi:superfamily I DNA/RNA helicase